MQLLFKCFVCYSHVGAIPYCAECGIALPNTCKIGYLAVKVEGLVRKTTVKKKHPKNSGPVRKAIIEKKRATGLTLSYADRVFERDGFKCLKCGDDSYITVDHIVPKCKGGKNHFSNLQTLCSKCNG